MRDRHVHDWVSVSSQTRDTGDRYHTKETTLILQRCTCKGFNTISIDGKWSNEELGILDSTVRDLMILLGEVKPNIPQPKNK